MASFPFTRFFAERPYIVSLLIILVMSAWLGLGSLQADDVSPQRASQDIPLAKVSYQTFTAQNTYKTIELYGRTAPDRQANLGAEIAGKIIALKVEKGESVKQGQVIAQIDKGDLDIQLERAHALLKVREKEFNAAKSLKNKDYKGRLHSVMQKLL